MASSKEYLQFILGQLAELEEISYRAMMGEFIIYYRGKIVGGIYDDRLLVKPVKAALSYLWVIKSFCRAAISSSFSFRIVSSALCISSFFNNSAS